MTDSPSAGPIGSTAEEVQVAASGTDSITSQSIALVMGQVQVAAAAGDVQQVRELVALAREISSPVDTAGEAKHRITLDRARIAAVLALITALFGVIIYAVASGQSDATQLATPISGLAGIAIGWLFTSSNSQPPTR